jgi:hypothetical protein
VFEGIGFRQKGLSLVSSSSPSLATLVGAPTNNFFFFFLLGEFFRLDLKLLFLGTLTIQEGGTMSLACMPRSQELSFSHALAQAFLLW